MASSDDLYSYSVKQTTTQGGERKEGGCLLEVRIWPHVPNLALFGEQLSQ